MTIPCARRGKWFGGCKFVPRYDSSDTELSVPAIHAIYNAFILGEQRIDAMRIAQGNQNTYIHDICIRCGRIAKPETPTCAHSNSPPGGTSA